MAFTLDNKPLPIDVAFSHNDINYPANWLRLSTLEEKEAIGIKEIADKETYDSRFYNEDGSEKQLDDENAKDNDGNLLKDLDGNQAINYGVKTLLKRKEKETAYFLLSKYDWQIIRKAEKNIDVDPEIVTFRENVRSAYSTRITEINNCTNIDSLVTLYSFIEKDGVSIPNMTQYPKDPYENT